MISFFFSLQATTASISTFTHCSPPLYSLLVVIPAHSSKSSNFCYHGNSNYIFYVYAVFYTTPNTLSKAKKSILHKFPAKFFSFFSVRAERVRFFAWVALGLVFFFYSIRYNNEAGARENVNSMETGRWEGTTRK